jgi:hypothetical protein
MVVIGAGRGTTATEQGHRERCDMSHFTCLRVVEGARLESEAREEHRGTRRDLNAHALNELAAWKYPSV